MYTAFLRLHRELYGWSAGLACTRTWAASLTAPKRKVRCQLLRGSRHWYMKMRRKSQSLSHRARPLRLDQALTLCFREGSMADYVDSWPLFLRHRKKAVKLKTYNGLTSAPGVFLSTLTKRSLDVSFIEAILHCGSKRKAEHTELEGSRPRNTIKTLWALVTDHHSKARQTISAQTPQYI